jgi:hypothetical protein
VTSGIPSVGRRIITPRICDCCGIVFFATGTRERWCSAICSVWCHIDVRGPNECWPSTLAGTAAGYILIRSGGETFYAHRLICEAKHGPLPGDVYAMHECDNPPCLNPRHLHPGSPTDNVVDMYQKGRQGERNYATGDRHGRSRKAA